MRDLLAKVRQSGLKVVARSHLVFFLYPAFWVTKKRGRRYLSAPEEVQKEIVSRNITTASSHPLMHKLMELEAALRRRIYYPFGIRNLITCQRGFE